MLEFAQDEAMTIFLPPFINAMTGNEVISGDTLTLTFVTPNGDVVLGDDLTVAAVVTRQAGSNLWKVVVAVDNQIDDYWQLVAVSSDATTKPWRVLMRWGVGSQLQVLNEIQTLAAEAVTQATAAIGSADAAVIAATAATAQATIAAAQATEANAATQTIFDVQTGGWQIVGTQLILSDPLDVEICRFNLFDENDVPTSTRIFKRERV